MEKSTFRTVCVLSGGLDSTTLLHHLLAAGDEVAAISFDYGQRHVKELDYAARSCRKLGIDHKIVDLGGINPLLKGSALTSAAVDVPRGGYAEENMKATVVPNRNMVMMAIAGAFAISHGFDRIAVAVHAGDHEIYPDCRADFIEKFAAALRSGNYEDVSVHAPFLHWSKAEIARRGHELGIDFQGETWSCYLGEEEPCGVCGTCVERIQALGVIEHE